MEGQRRACRRVLLRCGAAAWQGQQERRGSCCLSHRHCRWCPPARRTSPCPPPPPPADRPRPLLPSWRPLAAPTDRRVPAPAAAVRRESAGVDAALRNAGPLRWRQHRQRQRQRQGAAASGAGGAAGGRCERRRAAASGAAGGAAGGGRQGEQRTWWQQGSGSGRCSAAGAAAQAPAAGAAQVRRRRSSAQGRQTHQRSCTSCHRLNDLYDR